LAVIYAVFKSCAHGPAFLNRTVDFHSILTPWAFLPRGLVTGVVEVDEFLSLQLSLPISTMWLAGDG
jgi:hypothetical protein